MTISLGSAVAWEVSDHGATVGDASAWDKTSPGCRGDSAPWPLQCRLLLAVKGRVSVARWTVAPATRRGWRSVGPLQWCSSLSVTAAAAWRPWTGPLKSGAAAAWLILAHTLKSGAAAARLVLAHILMSGAVVARRRQGQDGATRRGGDDASQAK